VLPGAKPLAVKLKSKLPAPVELTAAVNGVTVPPLMVTPAGRVCATPLELAYASSNSNG